MKPNSPKKKEKKRDRIFYCDQFSVIGIFASSLTFFYFYENRFLGSTCSRFSKFVSKLRWKVSGTVCGQEKTYVSLISM
jgi:hypothetical protein